MKISFIVINNPMLASDKKRPDQNPLARYYSIQQRLAQIIYRIDKFRIYF